MSESKILRKYYLLLIVYGAVFGVRFPLDVWIFQSLSGATGSYGKFLLVSLGIVGMLVGEVLASRLACRRGYSSALGSTAVCYVIWALTTGLAILMGTPVPMYLGTG